MTTEQNYLKKKDLLRKYKYSEEEIVRKERRIKYLKERMENITGVRGVMLSDMPKGGVPKEFTDYVDEYLDEIKILLNNIRRKKILTARIEEAIENMEDAEHQRILKFIYFDHLTIIEVAEIMYISERGVKYKHKRAIMELEL